MFEIVGDDIAMLNDTDLRALVGLLCEAELRGQGLPTTAVTWGGNQTAGDGGLDVRVELPAGTALSGNIPRHNTGFQVKKPDMPKTEIVTEMKPKGIVRPVLLELAAAGGAYIIVSSSGSTADKPLKDRKAAMVKAVEGTAAEGRLHVDFFDRNRVATWVRSHPGMIPWVRSRIGKAVPGWQSFGSWSHTPAGDDARYIEDGNARIYMGRRDDGNGVSTVDGLNEIRSLLAKPGTVVRLVGLSGVGKTRFAEALFDNAIGNSALDPSIAIYTDVADEPSPAPKTLASDLNASRTRAIVIVDNCSPELHRQLSGVARAAGGCISVLTIEYDIREDQPEGTDVFSLEASSSDLIEKLISRRYPDLSQVDAQTIAGFSGGNARVALALASRVGKAETVAGLTDQELFKRLFQQRHDPDPSLLTIAEACSLVYSFEGEITSGENAELPVLGGLVGKTADVVHAAVVELCRRDLVQKRGPWRAVLPHAVANRLARTALQNIPRGKIKTLLIDSASPRVLRSFSRRLGYLDDSTEAKTIVADWLSPGGMLGDIANLSEECRAIFNNIAPVAPQELLSALEKTFGQADKGVLNANADMINLLRLLAYDAPNFERAVTLMLRFELLPGASDEVDEFSGVLASLFYIALSGTHAPIELRIKLVRSWLSSEDAAVRAVGLKCLSAMMKTSHFSSRHHHDFGARSRDYGYYPATTADVSKWFEAVIDSAAEFSRSGSPAAAGVRKALARSIRGLWMATDDIEKLDNLVRAIASEGFWRAGWLAVRQTLAYEGAHCSEDMRSFLVSLEDYLKPKDLVDQVRGVVINSNGVGDDLDDDECDDDGSAEGNESDAFKARVERAATRRQRLGNDVGRDQASFDILLPELIASAGGIQDFGRAVAQTSDDPDGRWQAIVSATACNPKANLSLASGFLSGLQIERSELVNGILDGALEDPTIGPRFPELQASLAVDELAVARLNRALDVGIAPVHAYYGLAYGRAGNLIPDAAFRDLVLRIARLEGGLQVALMIVAMRMFSDNNTRRVVDPAIVEAGRALLDLYEFRSGGNRNHRDDHELGRVIANSLKGEVGAETAGSLCRKYLAAVGSRKISASDFDDVLESLLKVQPMATLDQLFSGDKKAQAKSIGVFQDLSRHRKFVMDVVPDDTLMDWITLDADVRFPVATAIVKLHSREKQGGPSQWTPPIPRLLKKAPDPRAVLKEIVARVAYPTSWSGSLATKLEGRLELLLTLPTGGRADLVAELDEATAILTDRIAGNRRSEEEESRLDNSRFE